MTLLDQFQGDVQAIIRYAFRVSSRPIIAGSGLFRQMMSSGVRISPGKAVMTAHDDHAQAAAILLAIDQLPALERAVVYGFHDGSRRAEAITSLLPATPRPGGIHDRVIQLLLAEWMDTDGRKIGRHLKRTQHQLVDAGEIPRSYTSNQLSYARRQLFSWLNTLDLRATKQLAEHWARK